MCMFRLAKSCDLYHRFFGLPDFYIFGGKAKLIYALRNVYVSTGVDVFGEHYSFFSSMNDMLQSLVSLGADGSILSSYVVVAYESGMALFMSYQDSVCLSLCEESFSPHNNELVSRMKLFDMYYELESQYVPGEYSSSVFSAALLCMLFWNRQLDSTEFSLLDAVINDRDYMSMLASLSRYVELVGLQFSTKMCSEYDSDAVLAALDAGYGLMLLFVKGTVFPDALSGYGYMLSDHVVTLVKCDNNKYYLVDISGIREASEVDIVNFVNVKKDLYKDDNIWPFGFLLVGIRNKV